MSNDEQAWYTEPAQFDRELPEEPLAPAHFRVGTVQQESVPLEPMQRVQAREADAPLEAAHRLLPTQEGELLQPMQRLTPTQESVPLQPFERARPVETTPLQPFERATPVESAPLRSFERDRAAEPTSPTEPLQAMRTRDLAEPLQATRARDLAEPLQATQARDLARPLQRTEATRRDAAQPTARTAATKRRADDAAGNAGKGFQVDPAQYQAAVSPMLAASEQVANLYRSLSAFLPAMEAQNPWGNDESGKKFAEGEKGYLKYSKDTLDVLKGLPDALKGIADGLKAMAAGYENADSGVVAELGSIETDAVAMPASPAMSSTPVHVPMTPRITQSGRH
ncbi:hypothetical protein [Kitasatospora sp. NPDC088134]|uniref:hypothetical protein n=1 Tax=Kitasatospora sp. NPDC088134 TaxID=3364071 RepID=UPI00380AAA88